MNANIIYSDLFAFSGINSTEGILLEWRCEECMTLSAAIRRARKEIRKYQLDTNCHIYSLTTGEVIVEFN